MKYHSAIQGNGRTYNKYSFAIQLKNEVSNLALFINKFKIQKFIDLIVNSEVAYYYSKDKSDENVHSAKMVDPAFRKRLKQLG